VKDLIGHKLNEKQVKAISEMVEAMQDMRDQDKKYGDEAYLADQQEEFMRCSEELLIALGIFRKRFF
jgi:hypothetical protein